MCGSGLSSCMVMLGHSCSCMVMCGYVRSCMVMWGHVRSFGQVWSCVVKYIYVWACLVMHVCIWSCLMFVYVWSCIVVRGGTHTQNFSDRIWTSMKTIFGGFPLHTYQISYQQGKPTSKYITFLNSKLWRKLALWVMVWTNTPGCLCFLMALSRKLLKPKVKIEWTNILEKFWRQQGRKRLGD